MALSLNQLKREKPAGKILPKKENPESVKLDRNKLRTPWVRQNIVSIEGHSTGPWRPVINKSNSSFFESRFLYENNSGELGGIGLWCSVLNI